MSKPLPRYLNDFLEYSEVEKGLSINSVKNYERFINKFFDWLKQNKLEHLSPENLSEEHISKYRVWLSRRPNTVRRASPTLHPSTQIRYLIALRSFLAYFHEKNIPTLPTEKIKLPKDRKERLIKFLDVEQLRKFFDAPNTETTAGLRDRALLETLFSTGLRVAELVALDTKQLESALNKNDFELSIVGKGGYPRTVYFSDRALCWIKKYLKSRTDDDEALFLNFKSSKRDSRRLSVRGVELIVEKYSKMSGISFLATPHTFRHSFATDLLNKGVDLRIVQEFLGHRNIATTQIYTHVTSKHLREIHKKFHGGKEL
ncbi:MAG: Tyrosine recombinase XerC [Parcubacteria group bacterium GW2011_GWA2_44_15]|nr:MAG: Tyrosine recombinase XerC [Parcubacteria group bacterium GW2011_GWA2_44_15]